MKSAWEHGDIVEKYNIGDERGILGPFQRRWVQVSPFGVIPKSELGKWRLILDLSSPSGYSVNEASNYDHILLQ